MSPSWRESLRLDVGAAALRVRRYSRGWRPSLLSDMQTPLAAATPEALASAVAAALSGQSQSPQRAAAVHVQLSGDWTRLALLDGASALRGSERGAAATHALRRVYGDPVDLWQVCHGRAGRDTLLAAGIDRSLHEQLATALAGANAALASLQPSFVAAFNACLRWLEKPSWLVVVEPGRAVVGFVDGQQLRSLRCHRLQRDLVLELPAWLAQQRLVGGFAEPQTGVVLAYCGAAPIDPSQLDVALMLVDLDAVGAASPARAEG